MVFAAWVGTAQHDTLRRASAFTLAITLIYFCHLFAVASLAGDDRGCYETARLIEQRGFNPAALLRRGIGGRCDVSAGSAITFLFLRPPGIADATAANSISPTRMLDRFESLIRYHFDAPAYAASHRLADAVVAGCSGGPARGHRIRPCGGCLRRCLSASLVAPEWAMGGWAVHLRLPAFFCVILFAATDIRLEPRSRRARWHVPP